MTDDPNSNHQLIQLLQIQDDPEQEAQRLRILTLAIALGTSQKSEQSTANFWIRRGRAWEMAQKIREE